jgi:hypothetical protein
MAIEHREVFMNQNHRAIRTLSSASARERLVFGVIGAGMGLGVDALLIDGPGDEQSFMNTFEECSLS